MMRRRPRSQRDAASVARIQDLLSRWYQTSWSLRAKNGDELGEVTADLLEENGFNLAADDLRWAIRNKRRTSKAKLVNRISSEILGGRVLAHGLWAAWRGDSGAGFDQTYVAIHEPERKGFNLGEGIYLWHRGSNGDWGLWGTYLLEDYARMSNLAATRSGPRRRRSEPMAELLRILRSDIRYETQSEQTKRANWARRQAAT